MDVNNLYFEQRCERRVHHDGQQHDVREALDGECERREGRLFPILRIPYTAYLCFASPRRIFRSADPTLTPFMGSSLLMDPTLPQFNSECSSLTGDSSLVV